MELKYRTNSCILIISISSNRTFMELKYLHSARKDEEYIVLIVPLWN